MRRGGASRCANCTYVATWNHVTNVSSHQMDHLVCFVPGMLALGSQRRPADDPRLGGFRPASYDMMSLAEDLMETCYRMYSEQPSGLAPEIATFGAERVGAAPSARHSLLRPEAVESLFVLWRLTGEQRYREWGWRIFEAIEAHAKVDGGGYSSVADVTRAAPTRSGKMESFFTAETLKYLYLLFGDDSAVPLDRYVFNTEAHPLEIHEEYRFGAAWGSQ